MDRPVPAEGAGWPTSDPGARQVQDQGAGASAHGGQEDGASGVVQEPGGARGDDRGRVQRRGREGEGEGVKVYGWDPVKLSSAYTLAELNELREKVEAEHRLAEPDGILLFDKKGYWKLQQLAWAVHHVMS